MTKILLHYTSPMRRNNVEDIEIKEPPLQELNKKRSCLKRSCLTGCGCILIFILVSVGIIYFAANPRKKELREVPAHFPADIPIYDKDAIHSISFVSGAERGRWIELAAYVPKVIVSPLLIALENDEPTPASSERTWEKFIRVIEEPVSDRRDYVVIEWSNVSAQPKFVDAYYQNALKKADFSLSSIIDGEGMKQFSFQKDNVDGSFFYKDDPKSDGTDTVVLNVRLPGNATE